MQTVFLFGALRVILEDATGRVLAILDAITRKNADGMFSKGYIDAAVHAASLAWASKADH